MGSTHAQSKHSDDDICSVVRYTKTTWAWSDAHDQIQAVNNGVLTPRIMQSIQEFCFDPQQPLYITQPTMVKEPSRCMLPHKLQQTTICPDWHSTHFGDPSDSLSIALHCSQTEYAKDLLSNFTKDLLPALSMPSKFEPIPSRIAQVRRTIQVDDCQFSLHLMALRQPDTHHSNKRNIDASNASDIGKVMRYAMMHLVIVDDAESLNRLNQTCRGIWQKQQSMDNVLIVQSIAMRSKSRKIVDEIAAFWNVPCLRNSGRGGFKGSQKRAPRDLFEFAVKYYWFSSVASNSNSNCSSLQL